MLNRIVTISKKRNLYLFCLTLIAIGLSLSKPLISLGEIGLFLLWIFNGALKQKIVNFYKNKAAFFVGSIYFLTLLGLAYTSNFDYAIGDVRRKNTSSITPSLYFGFCPYFLQRVLIYF